MAYYRVPLIADAEDLGVVLVANRCDSKCDAKTAFRVRVR